MFPVIRWLLCLGLLLPLAGCRSNPQQQALVERELRLQEDRIFQLEDQLAETVAMLNSARRENSSLRNELNGSGGGTGSNQTPTPARPPVIELGPPGEPGSLDPPDSEAPYYTPPLPEIDDLEPGPLEPGSAPGVLAPMHDDLDGAPTYVPQSDGRRSNYGSGNVAQITLNKQLTGGHDRDGKPGDEGLMVVIEPRNEQGELLETAGALSIVVTDPTRPGPSGRVARWDFSEEESAQRFRKTLMGGGMHIELPWPAEPPTGQRLDLYIRYVTPDGRRLYEQKQIMVDPLPESLAAQGTSPGEELDLPPLPQLTAQSASEVFGEDRSGSAAPNKDDSDSAGDQWNRRSRPQQPTPARVERDTPAQEPTPAKPHQVEPSADRVGKEPTPATRPTEPAARTGQRTPPSWRPYR